MTAIHSTIELSVCDDCIAFIANGDENTPDIAARLECWWPTGSGWTLVPGSADEDNEGDSEFSWAQCDGCGTTLGGARYPAVALQQ